MEILNRKISNSIENQKRNYINNINTQVKLRKKYGHKVV